MSSYSKFECDMMAMRPIAKCVTDFKEQDWAMGIA